MRTWLRTVLIILLAVGCNAYRPPETVPTGSAQIRSSQGASITAAEFPLVAGRIVAFEERINSQDPRIRRRALLIRSRNRPGPVTWG